MVKGQEQRVQLILWGQENEIIPLIEGWGRGVELRRAFLHQGQNSAYAESDSKWRQLLM